MHSETIALGVKKIKKAFTLIELIVAILISAIVLSFILVFLWDTMDNIASGKSNTKILISFSEFQNKLSSYKNIYSTWYVLIDNDTSTWSDIFLMRNLDSTDWIIISRIDLDTKKIIEDNSVYKNSPIWIRRVSASELWDISSTPSIVNGYVFKNDKIYKDLILKDFQVNSYNSWYIDEFDMVINPYYINDFKWEIWENLKTDELLNLNINF